MLNEFLESLKIKVETGYKVKEEIKECTEAIMDKHNYDQILNNYNRDRILLIKAIIKYTDNNEWDEFINPVDACDYYREDNPILESYDASTNTDIYITIKSDKIVVEKIKSSHVPYSNQDDEEISIYNIPIEYFEKGIK